MNIYYYICHHLGDQINASWRSDHEHDCYYKFIAREVPEQTIMRIRHVMSAPRENAVIFRTTDGITREGTSFITTLLLSELYNTVMAKVGENAVDYLDLTPASTGRSTTS